MIPVQKHILEQYTDLQKEEKDLARRIASLEIKIQEMEEKGYTVGDSVTCGKRGKKPLGTRRIQGFPHPEYSQKKGRLKTYKLQLELADQKLLCLLTEIEEYIQSIEDSRMRRILRHRYVDNMTWQQVAVQMGGNNTADGCRMEHERYLLKEK